MKKILILLLLFSCSKPSEKREEAVAVKAICVEPKSVPANFEFVGVAESSHIVQLRARVEGYLESINYIEGSLVHEGDLMFVLDQRPFIAALESARGTLEKERALLWNAQQTLKRMIPLYHENAVSERDYDNAIAEELTALARVESAKAELYKAEVNLSYASIKAPVTGLSSDAKFREGALIAPNENLLTTIYVVDPIWVNFNISDLDYLKGQKEAQQGYIKWPEDDNFSVEAILADGTIVPASGKIDFLNPAVQQSTGTFLVRSVFENKKGLLFPGQFVKVIVKGAIYPNALLVPQTAVLQGQGGMFVYVIREGKAMKQPVEPGEWYSDDWIIHQGLEPGDIVVTEGVNKIQNGTPVKVVQD